VDNSTYLLKAPGLVSLGLLAMPLITPQDRATKNCYWVSPLI